MSAARDVFVIKGRIAPHEIGYVNAQLDACEGIGVIRTIHPEEGRVVFWVSPDLLEEFYALIEALKKDAPIELEPGG